MNINLTLVGEIITFAVLVFVTMKYIWPPITKAMQERQKKIADGLEAAERGKKSLDLAQENIKKQLQATKQQAGDIIDQANRKMAQIIEEAKAKANQEGKRLLEAAEADIAKELEAAKQELRSHIVELVLLTTEKLLQKSIDKKGSQELIAKFIQEI